MECTTKSATQTTAQETLNTLQNIYTDPLVCSQDKASAIIVVKLWPNRQIYKIYEKHTVDKIVPDYIHYAYRLFFASLYKK